MTKLTPSQALLVWCLVAKQGAAWQADIKPAVDAKDRKALERLKILSVSKIKGHGHALWLKLDDDNGWGWAAANLGAELPPNHRALSDLLLRLKSHLDAADESLAGFIGSGPGAPEPKTKTSPKKAATSKASPKKAGAPKATTRTPKKAAASKTTKGKTPPKKAAAPKATKAKTAKKTPAPSKAVDVRHEIETAYLAVTMGRKGVEARLSDVRPHLKLPRATVDEALHAILRGDPKARLMPIDDQRSITSEDKSAAFVFAGEPLHILWIMP